MTRPASMVLPRPTSSAMSRLTRAMSMARTSGSSWKSSMLTPLRNGAWRNPRSALVAAPQRTASRKASSMPESSCPVTDGKPARSRSDADAAAERRLEKSPVGVGGCTPAHGIEEGVEHARIVLPRDGWQARALDDLSARLDLPDDFQFFAETVLVDRRERHAVLASAGFQSCGIDVGHHPLTTAHLDELPRLGSSAVCLRLPFVLGAHVV